MTGRADPSHLRPFRAAMPVGMEWTCRAVYAKRDLDTLKVYSMVCGMGCSRLAYPLAPHHEVSSLPRVFVHHVG